jgi:capsular polysaccharide biosynthesis protein
MDEEIKLRDILLILWKQKTIIVIITVICIIAMGLVNFMVLKPIYQTSSVVRLQSQNMDISQFQETLLNASTLQSLIEKNQLNKEYTVTSLRDQFSLEPDSKNNIMKIVVRGKDAKKISHIANILAFELGIRVEIAERSNVVVESKTRLEELTNQLAVAKAQLAEIDNQLKHTPEKLIITQALSENDLLRNIEQERLNTSAAYAASLQMQNEVVNPLYEELKSQYALTQVQLQTIGTQAKSLEEKIENSLRRIQEIETKPSNEMLDANKPIRILLNTNAIFINPSIEPENPVGPNKWMNVALAAIVGLILSMFFVFLRHYLRESFRSGVDV